MSCLALHLFAYIYCFFPLFSPIDPEADDAPVIDYVNDDPSLPKQPGKQTPLEHSDIAHLFPSQACIRPATVFLYDPTPMHSLLLLPAFIPYLLILNCLV